MILRLAHASDDPQLRKLMRESIVPGHIGMAYTREPNFFNAYEHSNDDTQVVVVEDDGQIVGVGCRSIRQLLVNGSPSAFGYLSGLRLSTSAQKTTALARAYGFLRTLHDENPVPAYLTTIVEGNDAAQKILTSGRVSLPSYAPMGRYLTHVVPVKRQAAPPADRRELQVRPAAEVSEHDLTTFLMEEGARRQFFPVPPHAGTMQAHPQSTGASNMLVAKKGNCVVGTLSLWDQGDYKQSVVARYSRGFRVIRPLVNALLAAKRLHPLPKVGREVRYGAAAMLCIRDSDPTVFKLLMDHVLALAAERGLHHVAVGLHERDPLMPAMRGFFHVLYRSHLYLVSWDGDAALRGLRGELVPYIELGTL